jgi:DNA-binding response OmpR family regulator
MNTRVLVVEDDAVLARVLKDNLVYDGFDVQAVGDGHLAIDAVRVFRPDLILLDVMLPDKDGLHLCQFWREHLRIPIILLTARGQKEDKLRGLKMGADDYVTKPFDLDELLARVHAVLRRTRPSLERLTLGKITIDFETQQAWDGSQAIKLSHKEFALLRYLAERADTIVHRDELLQKVWGFPESPNTRAVDHAISRLRQKLEPDARHSQFILTAHGDGYCLTATAPKPDARNDTRPTAQLEGVGESPTE